MYSTCNTWADPHWNRWQAEINSTQVANSIAFIGTGTTGAPIDESQNVIVNSLTSNATPIGINVKTGDVTTYRRNANAIQARLPSTISAPNVADALYTVHGKQMMTTLSVVFLKVPRIMKVLTFIPNPQFGKMMAVLPLN